MSLDILLSTFPPGSNEQSIIQQSGVPILEFIVSKSPQIFLQADDILIHKFNVKISGFLKSKSSISKWFGCYLAKLSIENSPIILKSHGETWSNILIHLLELPEPLVTHQIVIQTLTSIFANTVGKPELSREITTPRLQGYLKLIINKLKDIIKDNDTGNGLISPILQSICSILHNQPAQFRPFVTNFQQYLNELLIQNMNSPSDDAIADICSSYVLIHMAATKGTEAEEWRSSCLSVINEINSIVNQLTSKFVREDINITVRSPALNLSLPKLDILSPFTFVRPLQVLFTLVRTFLTTPTRIAVKVPLGSIEELSDRLYSISKHTTKQPTADKSQYSSFLSVIDQIHILVTDLNIKILPIVGNHILQHFDMLIHHISILTEGSNQSVQLILLQLASKLLTQISSLPKSYLYLISNLVSKAISIVNEQYISDRYQQLSDFISNPKAFSKPVPTHATTIVNEFFISMVNSLPDLPLNLRAEIDRYFILTKYNHGLNVSSLYPGHNTRYSIAPMAIRLDNGVGLSTSLLHPRYPPSAVSTQNINKSATLNPAGRIEGVDEEEDDESLLVQDREDITYTEIEVEMATTNANETHSMEIDNPEPIRKELPTPLVNRVPELVVIQKKESTSLAEPQELVEDFIPTAIPAFSDAKPTYSPESESDSDDVEIPIVIDSDSDEDM